MLIKDTILTVKVERENNNYLNIFKSLKKFFFRIGRIMNNILS